MEAKPIKFTQDQLDWIKKAMDKVGATNFSEFVRSAVLVKSNKIPVRTCLLFFLSSAEPVEILLSGSGS